MEKLKHIQSRFEECSYLLKTFPKDKLDYMGSQSIISNIGASTRIENALLTDMEIEFLDTYFSSSELSLEVLQEAVKNKLSKEKERSIEEVSGYRDAINLIFNSPEMFISLRESDIKGLHKEILKYYPDAAHYLGNYKKNSNSVIKLNNKTREKSIVLKTADPGVITETAMLDLLMWYQQVKDNEVWSIPQAVEFVFRFLAIHPFQDGNGRLSRLLFQLLLLNSKESYFKAILPYCGLDRELERMKKSYYFSLQKTSNGVFNADSASYHYHFFLDFMLEVTKNSLKNCLYYAEKYDRYMTLSKTSLDILDFFRNQPESTHSTKEIIKETHIPRRTIIYSLNQLVKTHFLQNIGKGPASRYKLIF